MQSRSRPLVLALALAVASAGATTDAASLPTRHAFAGSAAMASNPERGFRHEIHGGCADGGMLKTAVAELRRYNLTVAQTYCYLSNETQLTSSALVNMDAAFGTLRRAGVKALWRFAYDDTMPGTHYYTEATVLGHIKQLVKNFAKHHDALYVLQAGFIGSWGEWHSSMTNLHANKTAVSRIVEAELFSLLPPDRKINVRVPVYKLSGVLRRPIGGGYGGLGTAGTPPTATTQNQQRSVAGAGGSSEPPPQGKCIVGPGIVVCPAWRHPWGSNESTLCIKNGCCWGNPGAGPQCYKKTCKTTVCSTAATQGEPCTARCTPMTPSAAHSSVASPMDFGVLDAAGSKLNTAVARVGYDSEQQTQLFSRSEVC